MAEWLPAGLAQAGCTTTSRVMLQPAIYCSCQLLADEHNDCMAADTALLTDAVHFFVCLGLRGRWVTNGLGWPACQAPRVLLAGMSATTATCTGAARLDVDDRRMCVQQLAQVGTDVFLQPAIGQGSTRWGVKGYRGVHAGRWVQWVSQQQQQHRWRCEECDYY